MNELGNVDRRHFLVFSLMSTGFAGCSALPGSGPQTRDIVGGASASAVNEASSAFKYALVDISQNVLAVLKDLGPGSLFSSFGTGRGAAPETKIGVGDSIQVTIFESAAGGLFIPSDAGARAGNFVQLPAQSVDQRGFISVPYAGLIQARGRTLPEIQVDIERKLAGRAIEPQVLVALVGQSSSQVTVIGQVGASNKVNISAGGDKVLDVLSKSAGITNAGYETFVTLVRKNKKATVYFLNLVTNPKENIYLETGDLLYVYQQKRAFTAFGAAGQNGQFKFEQETLHLADAVGKAGGLLDAQADPGQVLVYRLEYRKYLEQMAVDLSMFPHEQARIPTVYRANFRDPSSFFVAKSFFMQDGDVVYVTNADKVELFKFLELVSGVSGTIANVTSDAVVTRSNGRSLGRGL